MDASPQRTLRDGRVEQDLVAAAQHGDRSAYVDLIRPRMDRLYVIAHRILRDVDRAEDALQDALVIAWRDLRGLRDPDRLDAWLYRVVVRECVAQAQRERHISGPCGEVGCRGPQTPGTYTSRGLVPAVTYTLTAPWVQVRDWQAFFMLYPDAPENRRTTSAGAYAPYVLILPGATVSPGRQCAEQTSGRDDRAVDAASFSSFLFGQPGLTVSPAVPVAIGGLDGSQVDVKVGADWTGCLPGTPLGEPSSVGQRYRFIVLDLPGGDSLMIRLAAAPPADFDAFLAQAMPVVRSFVFAPTPSPSPS
jgi:DNA-directed RNA polymerase specialized sigma24 family protein